MQRLDSVAGALLRGTGLARGAVCAAFTDCGSSVGFLLLGGVRSYRSSPPAASEDSDSDGSNTRSSSGNTSSQEQPTPPGAWPAQPAYSGGLRDDPGHELATGGLYESARKDREPVPSPWPGTSQEEVRGEGGRLSAQQVTQDSGGGAGDLPASSYPIHDDPSTSMQHPNEAFRGPAEEAYGRPQPRDSQPPPADRPKQAEPSPHADVAASPGQMGVTRDAPPEDVQPGQVGAVRPPTKEQQRSEAEGFVRGSVGDNLKEPARGKLDEGADWAQSDRH